MDTEQLRFLPLKDAPLAVFDTETTGVDPNEARIVEFGVVYRNHVIEGDYVNRFLFNPDVPDESWREAQEVCGWNEDEMNVIHNSLKFRESGHRIHDALSGMVVAGYNIFDYDIPAIHAEERRAGLPETQFPLVIDVLVIVREFLRGQRERSLPKISAHLGYTFHAHRAVDDCRAVLHILGHAVYKGWLDATVGEVCDQIAKWKAQQDADWALYSYWLYHDRLVCGEPLMMGAGKECGMPLSAVPTRKLDWYLGSDIEFPKAVRDAFLVELNRR